MNPLFDPQQPSTSSASQHQSLQNTPATSPEWMPHTGQPFLFDAPAMPMNWQRPPMQPPPSQSILMVANPGGGSMRRQLAAMRLGNAADLSGSTTALNRSPSMASLTSVLSDTSNLSGMSGCSGLSVMSNISCLSVRTNYEPEQLNQFAIQQHLARQEPQVAEHSDETPQEQHIRNEVVRIQAEWSFEWIANEGNKMHPQYREYRKMVLRVHSKRDHATPAAATKLKQLADRFPEQMRKILKDLIVDVQESEGKERSDALNSLFDCVSSSPEPLASLLLNPPKRQSHAEPRISIEAILDRVDPRGGDTYVAVRILLCLLQPPLSTHAIKSIQKAGMTVEGTKLLLAALLHFTDVNPRHRIYILEALKKYGAKTIILEAGGVPELLRFLDRDDNGTKPAQNTLMFVEKDAELVNKIVRFLRVLVSISNDGKIARTRVKFIDEMAKHNAVGILSALLVENGMHETFNDIASILANISRSKQLVGVDLSVSIQHAIQLIGSDDKTLTFNLIIFLRNVCALSTQHKSTAINLRICAELLDAMSKWATASVLQPEAGQRRYYLNTISIAAETLHALTEPDAHHVHAAAVDSLLKAKDMVIQILMRVASFDFAYDSVRSITDPQKRGIASDVAFGKLPPEEQTVELSTKNYALNVIRRIFELMQNNIVSLKLATVMDPLLNESFAVMLWRRNWDIYTYILRLGQRQHGKNDLVPVMHTLDTLTALTSIVYRDRECLVQVLDLLGVSNSAIEGTQPLFHPFKMLEAPMPQMAIAVLMQVDALMHFFKVHAIRTHKHPMAVWLQPNARDGGGDYKQQYYQTVVSFKNQNWLPGEVAQRLINYFNECMGVYSPAMTPAFANPPQMPHPGYLR